MTDGDHDQDEPGRAGVRAEEARRPVLALGGVRRTDAGEDAQRHEHGHGEEVLDEPERPALADEGDEEVSVEEGPVGLEDGEQQDGEAPEREGMGHARDRPSQQLALAADLGELGPDRARNVA